MKKFLKIIILIVITVSIVLALPEIFHKNSGESQSSGTLGKGTLKNAFLISFSGDNFRYFSPLSYYLFNDGYTNSKVYRTVLEAYRECEKTCEGVKFMIMECSNKRGGKMLIHRTHQNGLSVDFMVPKRKGTDQSRIFDFLGFFHYLLDFTDSGKLKLNKKVEIDFEIMAKHILALDNAARKNRLRINKVILKIELKDDFFKTESGKEVKRRGIYFARSLPEAVNKMHDDHYHVDFEIVK